MTRGSADAYILDPLGSQRGTGKCDTLAGSRSKHRPSHRSSPLSRLDLWLWSGDPWRDPSPPGKRSLSRKTSPILKRWLPRDPLSVKREVRGCTPCGCPLHSHRSRGAAPMTRGSPGENDNDPLWVAEGGRRSATPWRGRGQDTDLSTGHRRCRGSTCGYGAEIPSGIRHHHYGVGFLLPSPPADPARDPGRGHFCIARVSRHEVPKTPGLLRYALIYTTPTGCRSLKRSPLRPTPWRGREDKGGLCFPGVVGATPLRPPGYEKRTPPGCLSPGALYCRTSQTAQKTPALFWKNPSISADHAGTGVAPLAGARSIATGRGGEAPMTRGSADANDNDPDRVSHRGTGKCDTLAGSGSRH